MSRNPVVTDQFRERLKEVARKRLDTPSNKQLARDGHCSESTVELYISRYMRELRESLVSCGPQDATIGRQQFADR